MITEYVRGLLHEGLWRVSSYSHLLVPVEGFTDLVGALLRERLLPQSRSFGQTYLLCFLWGITELVGTLLHGIIFPQ